jgi:tetratricopeptide (TPR) repeat protein
VERTGDPRLPGRFPGILPADSPDLATPDDARTPRPADGADDLGEAVTLDGARLDGVDVDRLRDAVHLRVFGQAPPSQAATPRPGGNLRRGAAIGRYVVLEWIGQGGMGVVYAAYDPELDRKVALKLVSSATRDVGRDAEARARMVREAQALAKLNHPNVVTVFDAGSHDDAVFLAMEFVDGGTLRRWMEHGARRWQDALAVMLRAGHGLAAAHAAGLLHRDFKPENVMLGGHADAALPAVVRVMDFGLARHTEGPRDAVEGDASEDVIEPSARHGRLRDEMTRTGQLLGTPGYMAAELFAGEAVDPRADQFAFCVATWEAACGRRPFRGDTVFELAAEVYRGVPEPPPTGSGVPTWLERILVRGLARDPNDRWPSMAALLAALERGQGRARRRRWAVGAIGAAAASVAIVGAGEVDEHRRIAACRSAGDAIAEVWNDDVRATIATHFAASELSIAHTMADKVTPWLDAYAAAWSEAQTETCLDGDVREVWSPELLDASQWCLDERRMELAALVEMLAQAETQQILGSVHAAAGLPLLMGCRDEAVLVQTPAPPPEQRASLSEMFGEYTRLRTWGPGIPRSTEAMDALLQQVETAGARALAARIRVATSSRAQRDGRLAEAELAASEAFYGAAGVGAWDVAEMAAIQRASVSGGSREDFEEGFAWLRLAEVAAAHARSPDATREGLRLTALAGISEVAARPDEAKAAREQALRLYESTLGTEHPAVARLLCRLGVTYRARADYEAWIQLCGRGLAIAERVLGPEHPETAKIALDLAPAYHETGDYPRAHALYDRVLTVFSAIYGSTHVNTTDPIMNLGIVAKGRGEYADALEAYERAIVLRKAALGPDHPRVAVAQIYMGELLIVRGDLDAARAQLELALASTRAARGALHPDVGVFLQSLARVYERSGDAASARLLHAQALALAPDETDALSAAGVRMNFGDGLRILGAPAEARVQYERALTLSEGALGPDHPKIAHALTAIGELDLEAGEPANAAARARRAVAIYAVRLGEYEEEFDARFLLARALVTLGEDRSLAHALALDARAGYRAAPGNRPERLGEIERWLAETFGADAASPAP